MTWESYGLKRADEQTRRGLRLIGRLVLRRRHLLGLSQRELEALSGIDQTLISRLENGRLGSFRWMRFARLVAALGGLGGLGDAVANRATRGPLPARDENGH